MLRSIVSAAPKCLDSGYPFPPPAKTMAKGNSGSVQTNLFQTEFFAKILGTGGNKLHKGSLICTLDTFSK